MVIKLKQDYMDRQVNPPRPVTSRTWGRPRPCNQALSQHKNEIVKPYLVTKHGWPWVRLSKERLPAAGFC